MAFRTGQHVSIRTSGPLFDGRARRTAARYADEVERDIATHAENLLHRRFRQVLRHPTGYYQSQVRAERNGSGYLIHDGGVVYGPWLEGTGSRNFPVTRFRGYSTFRRVKALVQQQARGIAERALARYRGRF